MLILNNYCLIHFSTMQCFIKWTSCYHVITWIPNQKDFCIRLIKQNSMNPEYVKVELWLVPHLIFSYWGRQGMFPSSAIIVNFINHVFAIPNINPCHTTLCDSQALDTDSCFKKKNIKYISTMRDIFNN